ncbi:TetR/AcrR family transcriptional regulator [Streptosporangium sp. NPDC049376]|uniref:TetR/AcrR family transcriptional regulator n=1 Tax=Streptosporangium sp. NPDC049376 TaxID=3366192 RepID=UPI0037A67410
MFGQGGGAKERDKLIEGAKRCLRERGYAHTTARDIARTSGANLASIGHHFGSKDALPADVMVEESAEWADKLRQAMAGEVPREGEAAGDRAPPPGLRGRHRSLRSGRAQATAAPSTG